MKLIEQIEIEHFRSFLGTPKSYETKIIDLKDVNIFSGANDSGKSNILRALNLFFNDKISPGIDFVFNQDFFFGKKDSIYKVIKITITFNLCQDKKRDKFLPETFKISKFYDRNGFRNYLYTFSLKDKQNIRIDSRPEHNKNVKNYFTTEHSSPEEERKAKKREWNYRVKFSGFLNKSISFEYVPAIRDKSYFAQLFGRVITKIKENEDRKISDLQKEKSKIINWEKTLTFRTEKREFIENIKKASWRTRRLDEIGRNFIDENKLAAAIDKLEDEINIYSDDLINSIDFLDSEFKIGKNLQEFFESFDVGTGSKKTISLKLRGDGIQAKYIPKILDFLSTLDYGKKYFLWGFEEPENSAEYNNQNLLASDLKETYSRKNIQILITTHSEEFLQLYDGPDILKENRRANLYHVKKMNANLYGEYSRIFLFDVDRNEFEFANQRTFLYDDLGHSRLRAQYAKELKERDEEFIKEKVLLQKENEILRENIQKSDKPIVFVEDTYNQIYKIAWLKCKGITFAMNNMEQIYEDNCQFDIFSKEGATGIVRLFNTKHIDEWKQKNVIGIFDFDDEGLGCFKESKNRIACLKMGNGWGEIEGNEETCLYRKRKDHNCFYAMLLPVPKHRKEYANIHNRLNYLSVELLFSDKVLQLIDCYGGIKELGCGASVTKIKGEKKAIWKKLFPLDRESFDGFVPLFNKVYEFINEKSD